MNTGLTGKADNNPVPVKWVTRASAETVPWVQTHTRRPSLPMRLGSSSSPSGSGDAVTIGTSAAVNDIVLLEAPPTGVVRAYLRGRVWMGLPW